MSDDRKIPAWIGAAFKRYGRMLGLSDISVNVSLVRNPAGDPGTAGCCNQRAEHNQATIELPDDIEDTPSSHRTIIHELIHVAHARVDHFFDDAILPLLKGKTRRLAEEGMKQHYESLVNSLAKSLYEWDQKKRR